MSLSLWQRFLQTGLFGWNYSHLWIKTHLMLWYMGLIAAMCFFSVDKRGAQWWFYHASDPSDMCYCFKCSNTHCHPFCLMCLGADECRRTAGKLAGYSLVLPFTHHHCNATASSPLWHSRVVLLHHRLSLRRKPLCWVTLGWRSRASLREWVCLCVCVLCWGQVNSKSHAVLLPWFNVLQQEELLLSCCINLINSTSVYIWFNPINNQSNASHSFSHTLHHLTNIPQGYPTKCCFCVPCNN